METRQIELSLGELKRIKNRVNKAIKIVQGTVRVLEREADRGWENPDGPENYKRCWAQMEQIFKKESILTKIVIKTEEIEKLFKKL
jgi:hypothetical protein